MKSLFMFFVLAWACAASHPTALLCAESAESADGATSTFVPEHAGAKTSPDPSPVAKKRGFFHAQKEMARRAESQQPSWLSPIATTSGRIKDEFRYDMWRPVSITGQPYYSFGGGKGLEFIVAPRVQLLVGVPTVVDDPDHPSRAGAGDMPFMVKFRVASAPQKKGDYLCTLILKATVPTGSQNVGLHHAVLTPAVALGKGWRRFDAQSTIGSSFPTGGTAIIGRQFTWDTAFQYRAAHRLWPEVEVNTVHYWVGKYTGETQAFLTPGLGFGRAHLCGPLSFSAGVGFQIAMTQFHTYNHQLMLSFRFPF